MEIMEAILSFCPKRSWISLYRQNHGCRGHPGIYAEWIDAIKNNTKSSTDFSYASKLVETMMLGNIAVLMANRNITLEYNPDKMEFTNLPEANELLQYKYREGWTL